MQNFTFFYSKTANKSGLLKWYLIIWLISIQILIFLSFKTIYWDLTHFLVSIKQAGVLNYFQLIYTPACLIHPARLIILKILYTGALNRYCSFNRYLRVDLFFKTAFFWTFNWIYNSNNQIRPELEKDTKHPYFCPGNSNTLQVSNERT